MRQFLEHLAATFADFVHGLVDYVEAVKLDQVVFPRTEADLFGVDKLFRASFRIRLQKVG